MTQVSIPLKREEKTMTIIGNGWINESQGKTFINVKLNKGILINPLDESCNFLLQTSPRGKREGKRDPDYMVSLFRPKTNAV